jgi:pyroglutamyl-peptidase
MRKVLLTGFDPFGGNRINPALEAVKRLEGIKIGEHQIEIREIPTVYGRSIDVLIAAIEEFNPEVVICVGQAGGRPAITPERIAINVNDARIADNEGKQWYDTPVIQGGPTAYWSTLPIKLMVKEMQDKGIQASISNSAGTFVCNHLFYGLMHYVSVSGRKIRGGFIHVPYLPEQAAPLTGAPSMSLEDIVKALKIATETAISHEKDITYAAGPIC